MISQPMAHALRRIPLPVLAHQLRRKLRDHVVPLAPRHYARRLARWTDATPELPQPCVLDAGLADLIGRYYRVDAAARAEAARGVFRLMGRQVDFGGMADIDWRHCLPEEKDHHLWRMKLCQLEVMHSLLAEGDADDAQTALALLDMFERATGFDLPAPFQTIWSPYGASHRILALLSGVALAQARGKADPQLNGRVAGLLRRDAAFVRANVEHDLRNNHTERNLAALCLYGMACGGYGGAANRRLDREVAAIIAQTILPDGMQIERSAMYQGLSLMALRIFAATTFLQAETRALARIRGDAAARAWALLSHRDGEIVLFNDAWMGEVPPVASVLGDVSRTGGSSSLPDAGYAHLAHDMIDVWMDAGAIGPAWNPGHGHADFLALELDVAGERLFVDPGTSQYSTGPRRAHERSAVSHNGPCFDGAEPVDYLGCFKVGRLAAARPLDPRELAGLPEHTIGGVLRTGAGKVRRLVTPLPDGALLIADGWSPGPAPARSRFLIPADWQITVENAQLLRLRKDMTVVWLDIVEGAAVLAPPDHWSRRYMALERAQVLDILPVGHDDWRFGIMRLRTTPSAVGERIETLQLLRERVREGL